MHNFSNIPIILTITNIIVTFDFTKFRELVLDKVYKVYMLRDFKVYMRSIWHI